MNTENEMNEEIRQLLDSLEEHGKNVHRRQELSDLIDRLAEEEKTVELLRKHRKFTPLWWAMGAAAACLLLWLLIKPTMKQTSETNEEIFVEETGIFDFVKTEVKDVILDEPNVEEELLTEKTTPFGLLRSARNDAPQKRQKETVQENLLAESTTTEPSEPQESTDTAIIESNTIPTESETPSSVQRPKRRVIRSLNLVCYECQKDPEPYTKPVLEDKTLFGQPQDPNMKNGSLAFEIKLN
jgi:hypothetical protein